jgi:hypothetical protein
MNAPSAESTALTTSETSQHQREGEQPVFDRCHNPCAGFALHIPDDVHGLLKLGKDIRRAPDQGGEADKAGNAAHVGLGGVIEHPLDDLRPLWWADQPLDLAEQLRLRLLGAKDKPGDGDRQHQERRNREHRIERERRGQP